MAHRNVSMLRSGILTGIFLLTAAGGSVAADAPFYKGKVLTMVTTSSPGGGTDTVGRIVARFWPRHIPGNPRIIVRNIPGGIAGLNQIYVTAPDRLTIGLSHRQVQLFQAQKDPAVKYDLRKCPMLGTIERGFSAIMIRKEALARLKDPSGKPAYFGATGVMTSKELGGVLGGEYLGWNLKFVIGYPSSNEIYLAYERGEVDMFGSATSEIMRRYLGEKGGMVAVAVVQRRPDFPEIPSIIDLFGNKMIDVDKRMYKAETAAPDKFFFAPPGTPKDQVAILRQALLKTTQDPEFDKLARALFGTGWVFIGPEETAENIAAAVETPVDIKNRIAELGKKYGLGY
ncbi:MAG: tripartite tricarboxylate transporter substrate-binding protein [Desulfobacterales bacterium]|nr:tripartite tricarboxylate transporter substrate-binding protein [Desulfobacterales bacterium]